MGSHRKRFLHHLTTLVALLRGETRVLNCVAFAIGEEGFQPHINADSRMLTRGWFMSVVWLSLTHDQGVPMPISTMHQANRLRGTLNGAMQLDLEQLTQFSRDMHMLVISIQPHITACPVLSELDGVPAIGLLETWEPTLGMPNSFAARYRLRDFVSLSASICTVVAGTCSPPRLLNRAVRSYFVGNVPSCSYCCFISCN